MRAPDLPYSTAARMGGVPLSVIKLFFLFVACFLLSLFAVAAVQAENWTCYDYAKNYTEVNPEWGRVTISENMYFRGTSHLVNYKVLNNDTLLIHDGMRDSDYILAGWKNGGFYHFWIDETPVRNYSIMRDNRAVLDENIPIKIISRA